MHAVALRLELRIPAAQSLKQKRRDLKRLIAQLSRDFSVSVAEVDHHELWQRATLGLAVVAPQAGQLERLVAAIERQVRSNGEIELLQVEVSYLERP